MLRKSTSSRNARTTRSLDLESLEPRLCLSASLPTSAAPPAEIWQAASGELPLTQTFQLASRPHSGRTIYLDFNGNVTRDTAWNRTAGQARLESRAWSLDDDRTTWTRAERQAIQRIWAAVAEDFAPFDVNITTQRPPLDDLRRTGPDDDRWGVRVVVGTDPGIAPGSLGIAYVGSFNWSSDTPAFVFATDPSDVALAISHEVGHTLGLRHDGITGSPYYQGASGWGPIMGNPLNQDVTQWSRGDYPGSNNTEDDLAIIAAAGLSLLPDDVGDTFTHASPLSTSAPGHFTGEGRIGTPGDRDVFRFDAAAGNLRIDVDTLPFGANLNVRLTLLDERGTVIASASPHGRLGASIETRLTRSGTYALVMAGAPLAEAGQRTDYGSLGFYQVHVTASPTPPPSTPTPTIAPVQAGASSQSASTTRIIPSTETATVAARPLRPISPGRPNTVASSVNVRGLEGKLTQLRVRVDIDHSWVGDLEIWLVAPTGQRILLSRRRGGNTDDARLEFRADASNSIAAARKLRGSWRPEDDFGRLRGIDPNGRWKLIVRDRAYRDGGRLNAWSLQITTEKTIPAASSLAVSPTRSALAGRPASSTSHAGEAHSSRPIATRRHSRPPQASHARPARVTPTGMRPSRGMLVEIASRPSSLHLEALDAVLAEWSTDDQGSES